MTPMISVLMPVYNGEKYLKEAIESILNQTYTDFEFLIINDGSTDKTEEIILSYADDRICYIKNNQNLGIVKTLNKGINLATGEYIARMDADDISFPKRFEYQLAFMDKHLDVGVCGTWLKTIGMVEEVWKMPISHDAILVETLFHSSLMHPTVFIRKSVLDLLDRIYDEDFKWVEDYELWIRLAKKIQFRNISKVLLKYRIENRSKKYESYKSKQVDLADKLRLRMLGNLGCFFKEEEKDIFLLVSKYKTVNLQKTYKLFMKILRCNAKRLYFHESSLEKYLGSEYWHMCNRNASKGVSVLKAFYFSVLRKHAGVSILEHIKLFIKCIIKYKKNVKDL